MQCDVNQQQFFAWVCTGEKAKVAEALAAGMDPNIRDQDGYTALHWAGTHGHMDIAGLLLDHGANADAIPRKQGTPLSLKKGEEAGEFHVYSKDLAFLIGETVSKVSLLGGTSPVLHFSEDIKIQVESGTLSYQQVGKDEWDTWEDWESCGSLPSLSHLVGARVTWVTLFPDESLYLRFSNGDKIFIEEGGSGYESYSIYGPSTVFIV